MRNWKYSDHLPLYRQSVILERETGVEISRATLDGWVMRVGDVGNSLAAYLTKGCPPSSERLVFLNHHPPYQPLRSTGVLSSLVNSLLRQAGILAPRSGTHVLRHYAGRRTSRLSLVSAAR